MRRWHDLRTLANTAPHLAGVSLTEGRTTMTQPPMRHLQQAVLTAGLLASAMAQAVTMTTTTEFGLPLVGGASLSSSGSLALFDPALGSLTGASLTLFASGSAAVDILNRPNFLSGPDETGGSMGVDLYVDWSSNFQPDAKRGLRVRVGWLFETGGHVVRSPRHHHHQCAPGQQQQDAQPGQHPDQPVPERARSW